MIIIVGNSWLMELMEYLHRHIKAHFWQPSLLCFNYIALANPRLPCKKANISLETCVITQMKIVVLCKEAITLTFRLLG